ncbi:MAG: transporter substrate-binding domain-containing protein [candidate division NC10 bacterium]|nr:transporter substrate-binding domain-containing protein [candidate division NC10 bacterium]MBI2457446.1 transporter substrate-binding domain-containing protein [candidate division NC10 bacterium]MBI2919346.1 transporter substrate-binding domain-containing protein [Chloroflexota bacterium]
MNTKLTISKRTFMKSALGVGGLGLAAKLLDGVGSPREAYAQLLESGIDEKSALARVKKEGKLRVGYAQTLPWFHKEAKTGSLAGIYYDVAEALAKELEVKTEYQEVSWADATVALRKGDFDVFGSSLFYTVPRALVVNYTAPLWHKGHLAVSHKDNARRFKSTADFNRPDVTFSINVGTREEHVLKVMFPKAKIVTTSGQIVLAAEPVRTKKADLWVTGDLDALLFAKKNSAWAQVVDPSHPFGRGANTWAIRYGDPAWKFFLDMWVDNAVESGLVQQRYDFYFKELQAS